VANITVSLDKTKKYLSMDEVVEIQRCMVNAGFIRKTALICQMIPDISACSVGAKIPVMTEAIRLNGLYCKDAYRSAFPVCQP
jgi:hypothetical protein